MFLPFYLPKSSFLRKPGLGITAALLWVAGQVSMFISTCKQLLNNIGLVAAARLSTRNARPIQLYAVAVDFERRVFID